VMLKNSSMRFPDKVNMIAIMQPMIAERFATYILSSLFMRDVTETKAITPLTGFTIEKTAVKTEMKNVRSDVIW